MMKVEETLYKELKEVQKDIDLLQKEIKEIKIVNDHESILKYRDYNQKLSILKRRHMEISSNLRWCGFKISI